MEDPATPEREMLTRERYELLEQVEAWLEMPMLWLGFVWLALLVVEFTLGLSPFLERLVTVIWILFVLDFLLRFLLAPGRGAFLKQNMLVLFSLLLPALRVLRFVQIMRFLHLARATRGLRLVRLLTSLNRGMRSLGRSMNRRGFGYIVALTALVTVGGAAGILAFERDVPGAGGIEDYGTALWWTAMIMTTMGSDYWPQTPEGRILTLVLSIYAFAVFGYVTATIATFFIGRDAESREGELAGASAIEALRDEIGDLREEIRRLSSSQEES